MERRPVRDLRLIAEKRGIPHKGVLKSKLLELLQVNSTGELPRLPSELWGIILSNLQEDAETRMLASQVSTLWKRIIGMCPTQTWVHLVIIRGDYRVYLSCREALIHLRESKVSLKTTILPRAFRKMRLEELPIDYIFLLWENLWRNCYNGITIRSLRYYGNKTPNGYLLEIPGHLCEVYEREKDAFPRLATYILNNGSLLLGEYPMLMSKYRNLVRTRDQDSVQAWIEIIEMVKLVFRRPVITRVILS